MSFSARRPLNALSANKEILTPSALTDNAQFKNQVQQKKASGKAAVVLEPGSETMRASNPVPSSDLPGSVEPLPKDAVQANCSYDDSTTNLGEQAMLGAEHFKAFVRVGRLVEEENGRNTVSQRYVRVPDPHTLHLLAGNTGEGSKTFKYEEGSKVFEVGSKLIGQSKREARVLNDLAKVVATDCLQGFNCTILAYGQAGSGKTSTLYGVPDSSQVGLIHPIFDCLFQTISEKAGSIGPEEVQHRCTASYFMVYDNQILDLLAFSATGTERQFLTSSQQHQLLSTNESHRAQPNSNIGAYIQGLQEQVVHSAEEILEVVERGQAHLRIAQTKLNLQPKQVHTILTCMVEQQHRSSQGVLTRTCNQLKLVDLAGSEQQDRGLLTLRRVVTAILTRLDRIPYWDSLLTSFLQDAFSGNARTWILANVSPALVDRQATERTLAFVDRITRVCNRTKANAGWALQIGDAPRVSMDHAKWVGSDVKPVVDPVDEHKGSRSKMECLKPDNMSLAQQVHMLEQQRSADLGIVQQSQPRNSLDSQHSQQSRLEAAPRGQEQLDAASLVEQLTSLKLRHQKVQKQLELSEWMNKCLSRRLAEAKETKGT